MTLIFLFLFLMSDDGVRILQVSVFATPGAGGVLRQVRPLTVIAETDTNIVRYKLQI